jgi:curli biogenesis system outer membrane secretion channel CsgG
MKKLLLLLSCTIVFIACKSTSATSTKLDQKSEVKIKGNWTISAVTYPGSEYIKVNSFSIADSQCFVGSNWTFVSNNNKGTMALTKSNCTAFASPITWFINKEGQFVMKILDAGLKAKKVKEGYILFVANQTENSFQLLDKIEVGGKMTNVVYQFEKTN